MCHAVSRLTSRTPCATCNGSCCAPGTSPQTCRQCNGTGSLQRVARSLLGNVMTSSPCPTCGGFGTTIDSPCTECSGRGRTHSRHTISRRHPGGRGDRHAHSHPAGGRRRHRWRAQGRHLRGDSAEGPQGLRAPRRRPPLHARRAHDRGRARHDPHARHLRRRARGGRQAGHALGHHRATQGPWSWAAAATRSR